MTKNLLSIGTRLIRTLLISGAVISLLGVLCRERQPNAIPLIFILNFVFFVAVMWLLAVRKLVPRIKNLAEAMDRAAEGNLAARVADETDDEFGKLNTNFNSMLERLSSVVNGVHCATRELRTIGVNVGKVAETGVMVAERQFKSSENTKQAALEISRSVEAVTRSVEGLAGTASDNSRSIGEISSSIAEINNRVDSLVQAIQRVSDAISDMTRAQKEINSSVNNLMGASSRTNILVGEMDRSVRHIEQNALETASISDSVLSDARSGKQSVESTIAGINEIRSASQTARTVIDNLSLKAADIGTILQVIDEVAERTNLLALNASIIAAQAGEQGKGFAVVADEIKTLARRTKDSTNKIAGIVTGVQQETGKAVEAIRLSETKVQEGERLSLRSGEALDKILQGLINSTAQVNEIARATVEHTSQSDSLRSEIEGISQMVVQIQGSTTAQTGNTELISGAAQNMLQLASEVRSLAGANNQAGSALVNSNAAVISMIKDISSACRKQTTGSEAIVDMAEELARSATGNLETTKVMEDAVSSLSLQIKALEQEMSGLKTAAQ